MSTRNFIVPKTVRPVKTESDSQQQSTTTTQSSQSTQQQKYIILFKPVISLDTLTLKNANILNSLKLQLLLVSDGKEQEKNGIRGFVCVTTTSDHEQKITATINSLTEIMGIPVDKLEYEVLQCSENSLAEALGITQFIQQEQPVVVSPPPPTTKKVKTTTPTIVNVKGHKTESKNVEQSPQMKKAALRQKYNI